MLSLDVSHNGVERQQVSMYVGQDRDAQYNPSSSS
jgi:hypothetical protein